MLLLAAAAMGLTGLGHRSVVLVAVGGVLLDLPVQCHQVMGQHEIYAMHPTARAHINIVYMSTVVISGALCSAVTGVLHDSFGRTGVCWFGTALPLVGFAIWSLYLRPSQDTARRAAGASPAPADRRRLIS